MTTEAWLLRRQNRGIYNYVVCFGKSSIMHTIFIHAKATATLQFKSAKYILVYVI